MRVLFSAANCLLDPSSGAAISIRTIFRMLQARGVACQSLTGSVFDRATSVDNVENLRQAGAGPVDPFAPLTGLWRLEDAGVEHFVVPLARNARVLQSRADENQLLAEARGMLDRFRPDVLITYGGGYYEQNLVRVARERGIATVFYVANPSYRSKDTFDCIDQVIHDTETTRALYDERLGLNGIAIGKFIDPPVAPAGAQPRHVTFVNPSGEKGVTLFYRIAELAAEVAPDLSFLVVESRARLAEAEQRTGMPFSRMSNVSRVGLQRDMGQVFGDTKVLLMPSLWHESGARAAIEALSLGIPVVASDSGGVPEVLGEAGIIISAPQPLRDNHWLIPPRSAAIQWVEALRQLVEDQDFYDEHRRLALSAWTRHDPAPQITALISLFERVIAARRSAR